MQGGATCHAKENIQTEKQPASSGHKKCEGRRSIPRSVKFIGL